jgi:hypothetical protein
VLRSRAPGRECELRVITDLTVSDAQIRETAIAYYTYEHRLGREPTGYDLKCSVQLGLVETKVLKLGDLIVFAHEGDVENQGAMAVGRARENRAKCAIPVDQIAIPAGKKAKQNVQKGQQNIKKMRLATTNDSTPRRI